MYASATGIEENCLDRLASMSQGDLYTVMAVICSNLYGTVPSHMTQWKHDDLMGWFHQQYIWHPQKGRFICLGVSIH